MPAASAAVRLARPNTARPTASPTAASAALSRTAWRSVRPAMKLPMDASHAGWSWAYSDTFAFITRLTGKAHGSCRAA